MSFNNILHKKFIHLQRLMMLLSNISAACWEEIPHIVSDKVDFQLNNIMKVDSSENVCEHHQRHQLHQCSWLRLWECWTNVDTDSENAFHKSCFSLRTQTPMVSMSLSNTSSWFTLRMSMCKRMLPSNTRTSALWGGEERVLQGLIGSDSGERIHV